MKSGVGIKVLTLFFILVLSFGSCSVPPVPEEDLGTEVPTLPGSGLIQDGSPPITEEITRAPSEITRPPNASEKTLVPASDETGSEDHRVATVEAQIGATRIAIQTAIAEEEATARGVVVARFQMPGTSAPAHPCVHTKWGWKVWSVLDGRSTRHWLARLPESPFCYVFGNIEPVDENRTSPRFVYDEATGGKLNIEAAEYYTGYEGYSLKDFQWEDYLSREESSEPDPTPVPTVEIPDARMAEACAKGLRFDCISLNGFARWLAETWADPHNSPEPYTVYEEHHHYLLAIYQTPPETIGVQITRVKGDRTRLVVHTEMDTSVGKVVFPLRVVPWNYGEFEHVINPGDYLELWCPLAIDVEVGQLRLAIGGDCELVSATGPDSRAKTDGPYPTFTSVPVTPSPTRGVLPMPTLRPVGSDN